VLKRVFGCRQKKADAGMAADIMNQFVSATIRLNQCFSVIFLFSVLCSRR